jgi:hypothetical protein
VGHGCLFSAAQALGRPGLSIGHAFETGRSRRRLSFHRLLRAKRPGRQTRPESLRAGAFARRSRACEWLERTIAGAITEFDLQSSGCGRVGCNRPAPCLYLGMGRFRSSDRPLDLNSPSPRSRRSWGWRRGANLSPKSITDDHPKPNPDSNPDSDPDANAPLSARHGQSTSLIVKTSPNTGCSIQVVYKSGPSTAQGLVPKTSDGAGNVSWTWIVGSRTAPGQWPIYVTCGSTSDQTSISVT